MFNLILGTMEEVAVSLILSEHFTEAHCNDDCIHSVSGNCAVGNGG